MAVTTVLGISGASFSPQHETAVIEYDSAKLCWYSMSDLLDQRENNERTIFSDVGKYIKWELNPDQNAVYAFSCESVKGPVKASSFLDQIPSFQNGPLAVYNIAAKEHYTILLPPKPDMISIMSDGQFNNFLCIASYPNGIDMNSNKLLMLNPKSNLQSISKVINPESDILIRWDRTSNAFLIRNSNRCYLWNPSESDAEAIADSIDDTQYKIDMNGIFKETHNRSDTYTLAFGTASDRKIHWENSFISKSSIINSIISNTSGSKFSALTDQGKKKVLTVFNRKGDQEESIDLEPHECSNGIGWLNDTTIAAAGMNSITIIACSKENR